MSLYCPYHKVFAYRNRHKCSVMSLITITKECKGIADRLYDLIGVAPLSVAHFVTPVIGALNEFYINIYIDLSKDFPIHILNLPTLWVIHTETISDDHLPLLVISYSETFIYKGGKSVNDRVKEIIKQFENHLDTAYDPQAIKSVLTLMYS